MVPPGSDDSRESEEAWRARAFKSKKAVPRPYKPSATRNLAPRPIPRSTPMSRDGDSSSRDTRDERESTTPSTGTPSPGSPFLQFMTVTDPLEQNSGKYRRLSAADARTDSPPEKRRRPSQEVYSETRAGLGQVPKEDEIYAFVGWDNIEEISTPSSTTETPSEYFSTSDTGMTKREPLGSQDMVPTPPLSRTGSKNGAANEDFSSAGAVLRDPRSLFSANARLDPFSSYPVKATPQMGVLINCFSYHCQRSESTQPFAVFSSLLIPDRDLVYAKSLLGVKDPGSQISVFPILFRMALTDPPLFKTLLFIGEFGSRGTLTEEALKYQGNAMRLLNEKLRHPRKATDNATIATILLLSGFEYIKGNNRQAHEAHMKGLSQLLEIRKELGNSRTESMEEREVMERGLFWSDLLGAVLLGSQRYFALEIFSTMRLLGAISLPTNPLPEGFTRSSHLLNDDFIEIIRDICDFQEVIESRSKSNAILNKLKVFNDRKSSIECRLASLDMGDMANGKSECCRLAIYLYSSAIFPPYFGPPALATVLSSQLAKALSQTDLTMCWGRDIQLLLWICFMGASFTKPDTIFSIYSNVLSMALCRLGKACQSWDRTISVLKEFLWSDAVFGDPCRNAWEGMKIPP